LALNLPVSSQSPACIHQAGVEEIVKKTSKLLAFAALLVGFATCASADTTWNLNNVNFVLNDYLGNPRFDNAATGFFVVDGTGLSLSDWDITITGSNTQANYEYKPSTSGSVFDPTSFVDFFSLPFTGPYINMGLALPLSNGSPINLVNSPGDACPGCTLLISGYITTTENPIPEPSSMVLLVTVAAILGTTIIRRKRVQTS
jgi:hypothetical protein